MLTRTFMLLLLACPFASHAINVGSVTTFIDVGTQEVSKEIENNSDQARLVTIAVSRISSPEEGGVEIPMEMDGELLLSPSRIVLPAKAKNNVRFFYKGPADDKERYYRITWRDTALSMDDQRNESRQAVATTSAQIGTILVVTPRQSNFDYVLSHGELTNRGNASYRVVAYGVCRDNPKQQCRETYYDLPGKQRTFKRVDITHEKGHVGLWLGPEFVVVK
ncbi:fimbria/pilus periplasmic chaperone [Aeromonas jandaei]|uniref:EcpB family pilus assembly chaperone n=2 Tax=Aeromonas TaxID=642 RepID=UPI00191DA9BF|nr:fimbria/pilus periplasmic chaperone [Aeromonas jandaei]MBL0669026.1 fimbria/pilus periplasmic chaperone [Aeromonas jandaei]